MGFLQQFTAWHFVFLALGACFTYLATTVGRRIGRYLLKLINALEELQTVVNKTEILWEKQADAAMYRELEKRSKAGA